jgi:hypothetical protein
MFQDHFVEGIVIGPCAKKKREEDIFFQRLVIFVGEYMKKVHHLYGICNFDSAAFFHRRQHLVKDVEPLAYRCVILNNDINTLHEFDLTFGK